MSWQNNYIDIHSHILPGVDDGSSNMEQSISMLHMAAKEHISTIIATPHYNVAGDNPSVDSLRELAGQLQEQAHKINKSFQILLGNEIYYGEAYYDEAIIEALQSENALTLAGSRYVLVEFSYTSSIKFMRHAINNLVYHGYIPILAHVERYYNIHRDPKAIEELVKTGCYMQMNCDSLMGDLFSFKAAYNRRLLNNDLIHFIASDCHSDNRRAPFMQRTVSHLIKKNGVEAIKRICIDNTIKILNNTYI